MAGVDKAKRYIEGNCQGDQRRLYNETVHSNSLFRFIVQAKKTMPVFLFFFSTSFFRTFL